MDDQTVLSRIADGDQSAVGELYDRYGRQVYSLACRMLADTAAAEDVTQEVFLKVWRNASRFDIERGRVASWILRITYTSTVDLLRSRRSTTSGYKPMADHADVHADPAGDAEVAVLGAQVRSALMRIPAEQRQILELAYFHALSQQEIAAQLNLPLGTVKSRVRLGLDALRQFLIAPRRKEAESHVRLSPRG